jgi:hypothetical protein
MATTPRVAVHTKLFYADGVTNRVTNIFRLFSELSQSS